MIGEQDRPSSRLPVLGPCRYRHVNLRTREHDHDHSSFVRRIGHGHGFAFFLAFFATAAFACICAR